MNSPQGTPEAQPAVTPEGPALRGKPEGRALRVELGVPTLVRVAAALCVAWLLLQLWPILMLVVVALMLVGMLAPPIAWLEGKGLRRGLAIAAVFLGLFGAFAAFGALTVPKMASQLADIVERLPKAQQELADQLQKHSLTQPLAQSARGNGSKELTAKIAQWVVAESTKIAETVAYAVTCLFVALYLIIDRDRMRGAFYALVPRSFHVKLSRILLHLETIVGGYLRGQVLTSLMMAVFTFIVLSVARTPNALPLAAFAGLTDVLPYIGALLACGPAVLATLARGTPAALVVLLVLAAYQELESRIIVPRVYGRVLRLPATTVMLSLLVGGKLLGILGALLALPIAAGIRMIVEELRVDLPGEDVDDTAARRRDAREERVYEAMTAGAPAAEAAAVATEIAEKRIQSDAAKGEDATQKLERDSIGEDKPTKG